MTQHRITIREFEQAAAKAYQAIRNKGLLTGTDNDPIFTICITTGSSEWSSSDFQQGDTLTALSGAVGEQIQCSYRFEEVVDETSFVAHNLKWDRAEGDVLYANITSRRKSSAIDNVVAAVTGAIEAPSI